ncbi:MAG: hypothetical protein ACFFB3_16575 [Candidatus Hodarchaeota archaeon]
MQTPHNEQPVDDLEAQLLEEVLSFWKSIPNSDLQKLASKGATEEASKLWEKDVKTFYHRFSNRKDDSSGFKVVWNDVYWKYYRSVLILDRIGAQIEYPMYCFRNQGISATFYEQFWKHWRTESRKTLKNLRKIVSSLNREILADFTSEELSCLQAAPRSVNDATTRSTGWIMPQFFSKETGISPNRLTKILHRLYAFGFIAERTYVNFAKIDLKPFFFVSQRDLEELELDYCFFQVKSLESKDKFSGLAVPPVAIKMGWHNDIKDDGIVEPIRSLCSGWNLSRLSKTGWGEFPAVATEPEKTAFGQVELDFQSTAIKIRPSDPLYLERIQIGSPRTLRAEFGVSCQQRLRDLSHDGVIQMLPFFRFIQCGAMIFICCRSKPHVLEAFTKIAYHFPRFRTLQGANWILMTLGLPPSWVYPSLVDLKAYLSSFSIEDLVIDVHQGRADRLLPFSKLWDQESKEWIA